MPARVLKAGFLDTVQNKGSYGQQHLGINPGGAMDMLAMQAANFLVGNDANANVLELHFPAARLLFENAALIALCGADFNAYINELPLPVNRACIIGPGTIVQFQNNKSGCRAYLAVQGGFFPADQEPGNRNTKYRQRLQDNDILYFKERSFREDQPVIFNWFANTTGWYRETLQFIPGPEYDLLDEASKKKLVTDPFLITSQSDRMGYRMKAEALHTIKAVTMLSSAVTRGTMQLLPNGQLIILMAEHQTTGGYPRVGYITSADLPSLSQAQPGKTFRFVQTDVIAAQQKMLQLHRELRQLQNACIFQLDAYLKK